MGLVFAYEGTSRYGMILKWPHYRARIGLRRWSEREKMVAAM